MSTKKTVIRRGNTGSGLTAEMKKTMPGTVPSSRKEAAHTPKGRKPRVSMNTSSKLIVPESMKEEGYYYRFFTATPGRINQALDAYYEIVTDEQGNNVSVEYKNSTSILMRLPQEYRDEDLLLKRKKAAANIEQEASVDEENEYAPDPLTGKGEGGNSAIDRVLGDNEFS